jgi:hypothetical protein
MGANAGSTLKGQKTELWSGGKMVDQRMNRPDFIGPIRPKYESYENQAGEAAKARGGQTLELGFGIEKGYAKMPIPSRKGADGKKLGEARATIDPWVQDDDSTHAPWLEKSSLITRKARGIVRATVGPERMGGLLGDSSRKDAGTRVADQKTKGGVYWNREYKELLKNKNVPMI